MVNITHRHGFFPNWKAILKVGGALVLAFLLPSMAFAHPHVFVDYEARFGASDGKSSALHLSLYPKSLGTTEMTITSSIQGIPSSKETVREIDHEDFLISFRLNPLTLYWRLGDQPDQAIHLMPKLEKDDPHHPVYTFDVPLPEGAKRFAFSVYDPSYYISVTFKGLEPLMVSGPDWHCAAQEEDVDHMIWGRLTTSFVSCHQGTERFKPVFVAHPQPIQHPLFQSFH